MIRVKYFASLRERMSRGEDLIEVSGDQLTLADVLARLTPPMVKRFSSFRWLKR